jgi:transcriptional antiterminator NusG
MDSNLMPTISNETAPLISVRNDHWYAIHTFTGKEGRVKDFIADRFEDLSLLQPKRVLTLRKESITKTVQKPLFPGYFFVNSSSPLGLLQAKEVIDSCYKRFGIPVRVLGTPKQITKVDQFYTSIPESEMRYVLFLTGKDELIGFSNYHKIGSTVKVVSGPLLGQEAIITRVNPRKNRITIQLSILGAKHQIDLGGECLSRT